MAPSVAALDRSDNPFLSDVAVGQAAQTRLTVFSTLAVNPIQSGLARLLLRCRCALVRTSAAGSARHWTASLLAAMVKLKRMTPPQALAFASQRLSDSRRDLKQTHALAAIAPYLDVSLLEEALKSSNIQYLARLALIAELSLRYPEGPQRQEILQQVPQVPDEAWSDPWALVYLARCLPTENRQSRLREAVQQAMGFPHSVKSMRLAATLACALDGQERSEMLRQVLANCEQSEHFGLEPVVAGLARPYLDDLSIDRVVASLDRIPFPDLHAKRLAELAPLLAKHGKKDDTLEKVRAVQWPLLRAKGLAGLAGLFEDDALLTEAETAANLLDDALVCAGAVVVLAAHLSDEERKGLLDKACDLARCYRLRLGEQPLVLNALAGVLSSRSSAGAERRAAHGARLQSGEDPAALGAHGPAGADYLILNRCGIPSVAIRTRY
jgi:hypothetical protein